MKKLLSLIAMMAIGLSATFAQTPATKTTTAKKVIKKDVKAPTASVKAEVKTVPAKTTTTATKVETVKKDGTPDMRFKENKVKSVTKPAGPVKKDGTADMRYKANKDAKKK